MNLEHYSKGRKLTKTYMFAKITFYFKNYVYTVYSRYLEHRAVSNKTLCPFSTNSSGVTTRYIELPAISNFLPGPLRVRDSGSRLYI